MKNILDLKQTMAGSKNIFKRKNSWLKHQMDSFLEECKVQKRFFSGQMSTEEYIRMKKTKNNR